MAGWFFFLIGALLVGSSLLAWNWSAAIGWAIAVGGLAAFAFGALAPRDKKVTAAMVVLALLQV
jgi:hypothetical protein